MGCLSSKELGYSVLRKSVPGALLTETDFDAFFSICKSELHTINTSIHVNATQLFYVVISGEVIATLSGGGDGKQHVATVFQPGELIHLFNSSDSIRSTGSIISGGVKLSFSFRSVNGTAKIIGAERKAVEDFLRPRPHLIQLRNLFSMDLSKFLTGPDSYFLQSLTENQVRVTSHF